MAERRSGDDPAYLLELLKVADISTPEHADDLPNLSPRAAEFRYAQLPEPSLNRAEIRSLVEETKTWPKHSYQRCEGAGDEKKPFGELSKEVRRRPGATAETDTRKRAIIAAAKDRGSARA